MKTVLGLLFTLLWSSAAIATKFGLNSTTPLVLATTRFLIAGGLLFLYVYLLNKKYPWPRSQEWRSLIVLGLLNTTIYLDTILTKSYRPYRTLGFANSAIDTIGSFV